MTPAFLRNLPSRTCVPEEGRNIPVCHMTPLSSSPAFYLWKLTFPYLCLRLLTAGRNISVGMATAVSAELSRNCGSFPLRFKTISGIILAPVSCNRGKFSRGLSHRVRLRLMPRLWMTGAVPPRPQYVLWLAQWQIYLHSDFLMSCIQFCIQA